MHANGLKSPLRNLIATASASALVLAMTLLTRAATADTPADAVPASQPYGVLILMRASGSPPVLMKPTATLNGESLGLLPAGSYGAVALRPGTHHLSIVWKWTAATRDSEIDVHVQAGEYAYVTFDTQLAINIYASVTTGRAAGALETATRRRPIRDVTSGMKRLRFSDTTWTVAGAGRDIGLAADEVQSRNAEIARQLAGSFAQRRLAAHRMVREHVVDEALVGQVRAEVRASYANPLVAADDADAVAWVCHALAAAQDNNDVVLLRDVAAHAAHSKVRRYAREYLRQYFKIELDD